MLLLDCHDSHTKNMAILNSGREHRVHILSFLSHYIHRLQPLEVGFRKRSSTYNTETTHNWLRANSGRVITHFQVPELIRKDFQKAAILTIAYNPFQTTEIWPLKSDIFTEPDFLVTTTTDTNLLNMGVFQNNTNR